ncbi:hypothetical protein POM88_040896 [Heracleum sosnowskyi]|uniref:peroxidase n=1 Tax=Heracleum sosnowskyi TaxID=360622 RepID=A0AAD8HFP3_9APIA|nr:hypothetical protein POM88_040896 [Heracleum sosnowskyi]
MSSESLPLNRRALYPSSNSPIFDSDITLFLFRTISVGKCSRDSVVLSGGPGWQVETGRMDSLTASKTAANNDIPGPNSDVQTLVSKFQAARLELNDMVTLSGAHTMGKARCTTFISRLNGI